MQVCEFLDTATVCPEAGKKHKMVGHKFEIRIVVYRDGNELKAFPSIAKVILIRHTIEMRGPPLPHQCLKIAIVQKGGGERG